MAEENEHFVMAVGFKSAAEAEQFRERALTEARHMGMYRVTATIGEAKKIERPEAPPTP